MSPPTPKVYDIKSIAKTAHDHDALAAALLEAGYEHYDASSEHDSYRIDASKLPAADDAAADAAGDDAPKKTRSR